MKIAQLEISNCEIDWLNKTCPVIVFSLLMVQSLGYKCKEMKNNQNYYSHLYKVTPTKNPFVIVIKWYI